MKLAAVVLPACGGVRRSAGAGAVAVAGRAGRAGVNRNRAGRGANRRAGISTGLFNNLVDFALKQAHERNAAGYRAACRCACAWQSHKN